MKLSKYKGIKEKKNTKKQTNKKNNTTFNYSRMKKTDIKKANHFL